MYAYVGLTKYPNGDMKVLVAGGFSDSTSFLTSVEVLNVKDSTAGWTEGTDLPVGIQIGASVPFKNTFLIVGGGFDGGYSDLIYEYEAETDKWITRQERLNKGREKIAAFWIPDEIARCS